MEDDKKYIVHDPSKGKVYYMTEDEYSARRDRIFQTPGVEVGVRRDIGADDEIDDKGVYYIDDGARGKRYTMTGEEYRARRDKIHANPAASVFTLDVDDYYGEQLADINRQIEEQERRTSTAKAQRNLGFLSPTPGAGAIRSINEKGARDELRYEEEQRTLDELRKAQWENPRYQEELKALGAAADKGKERVDALSEQIKDTGDYEAWVRYRSSTALVGDSDFASKDKAETELLKTPGYKRDMEALDAANYLYEDAKKELEKPSRYDGNAVLNFLTGVGGNIGKVLTLLSLDKEKRVSLPVMEAVRTIHEHEGEHANIIDLVSDPDKLSYLSDAQKEMLSALVDYTVSSQYRAGNTSLSYNAGAGAIESAGYMLDFVIGGKGAGAATKGLTKGLMRAVAKGTMRAGLKGATRKAALAVPKFAIGSFTSAAKSVLSTPLMPSSYTNFLSQMRQINDVGEVDLSGEALLNAAADVLIENFSEYAGTQVEGLLGLPLKAAGKAGSWLGGNTIGRMIGKTRWEAWADLISKAKSTSVLKDAAFNGFLGEWGEEWYGNAVRVMTGVDKDALKDFATAEQQLTVLGSFAPMSLFGGVTSGARYRRAQKRMDAAGQALEAALKKANYTQETINNILSVTKAENPTELAQSLAPVIQQVAKDNGNKSEMYKAVCDYAYAVAQYRTLDGVRDADATPLREAMQQDLSTIFGGDNWIMRRAVPLEGEDSQEETELRFVNTLTDKDGNELVVEAQGEDGTVAAVDMEGKRHYVSSGLINIPGKTDAQEAASKQYILSSLSLRDYLDQRLAARNVNAEALRMREEAAANQQALQQRVASEGVDFGPKEARQHGTLISADANGVQLQVAGQEAPVSMTWEQVAQEMNMPLNPQTDAELEEQELSRIDKMRSLNKSVPEGAGLIVPIDGESEPAVYKFIRAELSEGEVIIKATDSEGNEVDLAPEQVSNLGGYLSVAPAETENPAAPQMQDAPADVFDDPVANEIGIDPKYMTKTGDGRRIVNKKALWEGDPEKWAEYNDRNGSGISTIEYVKNKLDKINTTVAAAEAKLKQALLDDAPDDMEQALRSMLSDAQGRQRRIQALYDGYVAAEEQARKAAEAEAKAQRDAEDAKRQEEFQQKIEERKAEQARREERQQVMLSQDEAFRANTEAFLAAKKYVGRATRLNAGEQSYKAHYVIMEATVPVTSHDPFNGFQPTEGFPVDENGRSLNTRDYQREKEEMDGARRIAEKPDYRLLEYMPGLTAEGVTATGNKRCTARKMAAQMGTDTELVNLYREYAEEYGFTPEQVDEFEHPIIVKVIDESVPYTAKFFDSFNRSIGTAASTVATAAKIGKMTDDALILRVATLLRDFTDIKDAYQSATTMNSLFALLEKEGLVPREDRPRYLDSEGRLTGGGEDFVESLLFGTIFSESDNAIRSAMQDASIRRAVAFAFPTLVRLRSLSGDYTIMPELTDAVRLLVEAKAANDGKREGAVADYMNQFTILAEGLPIEKATVQMLANVLNENKYGSLRRVLDMYINRAEDADSGQSLMTFGDSDGVGSVETKETIIKDILDSLGLNTTVYDNSEQQQPAPADAQIRDASPEQGGGGALFDGTGETSAEPAATEGSDTSGQEPGTEVTQEIEAARSQVDTNPTEAQKKAGNYRKGHITIDGYDISIENPKGSVRSGTDASGSKWEVTMNNDYGYIRMTEGVDGDHIDVFLSDNPTEGNIFVVDQVNPDNGEFDEHKVMYGFPSEEEARAAYLANYSPGWKGLGNITEVSREEFKKWVESSHRKTKPFADYKSVKTVAPTKSTVQGLEKYSEEEIKHAVYGHTLDVALEGKERFVLKEITLIGSRTKGTAKEGSDLDVLLEYEGSMKEDEVFNALNGEPLYIDGIRVDINPIRKEQSGTTKDWLKRQKAQQAQEDALAFIGTTREQALLDVLQGELDDISRRMREHPEQRESLLDEKAAVIQNYCEQSQTDPTAKIVSTTLSHLEDAMRNEALSEGFISKTISKIAEALNDGAYPRAFRTGGGRLFMLADFLGDAQVVSSTFTHEEEHNITAQKQDDVALAKIGNKEAFLAAIDKWKGRIELYHRLSDVGVANEFISHALEMYEHASDTQIDKAFKELGINDEKIINFVKNRINERRNRKRQLLSDNRGNGRTDTLRRSSIKEDSGENGRNSEAEPGDRLDGQRPRTAAQSQRGAESGRESTEDRDRYEPSFVRDLSPAERDRLADLDRDGTGNLGIVDDINNEEPEGTALFSLKNGKSLIGLHNISAEQLTKALRLGGLANPSAAVIDINHQDHFAFGDISLIMPSSLVDSRTGRNAGTFTGDAYTPDFPAIKYFKTKESEKRLKGLLKGLPKNLADYIYDKVEQYINGDVYHSGLEYIFLKEKGIDLGIQEKQRRYPDASLDEFITQYLKAPADLDYMSFDALMGAYNALSDDERATANYYVWSYGNKHDVNSTIERMEKYPKLRERYTENIGFGKLNNFCYALRSDERNAGGEDMQRTVENAQNYISEQGYSNEFDAWLGKTIDELGYEGKIFSHWTYDGTKVYKKATLENISAKMRKEGLQNSNGTGGTSATKAMLLKRLRTLNDIRKNSYRLDSNAEEQYKAAQQQWSDVIEVLSRKQKIDDNPFSNFSYAEARLQEAILERDPIAYLNREYNYNLVKDGEFEKSLNEAVDVLRNLPSKYFETKFERPVYFGEFAAAVVPSGLESGIKEELKEQGLKLFEYDSKDEDSRREATRAAAEDDGILFSLANINQNIFVSNAARAVEGIKMEKATPEQWLKMIEKEGGLKAGEDKWMGLSDWLKESDKKTLTKQEVLDFINENKITIEETRYSENGDEMAIEKAHPGFSRAFYLDEDDFRGEVTFGGINDLDAAIELYNNEHEDKIVVGDSEETRVYNPGRKISNVDYDRLLDFGESLVSKGNAGFGMINSTRLDYTTGGLENKREIALTVPTIEPYNQNDRVHFGDAGEGRAVAWVRFGETTTKTPVNTLEHEAALRKERFLQEIFRKYNLAGQRLYDALTPEEQSKWESLERDYVNTRFGAPKPKKVLVIDEIQSKRHQDAREKGYRTARKLDILDRIQELRKKQDRNIVINNIGKSLREKGLLKSIEEEEKYYYEDAYLIYNGKYDEFASKYGKEAADKFQQFEDEADKIEEEIKRLEVEMESIPAAPFEKNWHELAFKRMLRLAAEEGYDYVAWTTGEQQAERYNIGGIVDSIERREHYNLGERDYRINVNGKGNQDLVTDDDGNVIRSLVADFRGKKLSDIVGKEMAQKMLQMSENDVISGEDLRVGGEGMKGFYDDMLPRFANKYGKKWGVKVEDIELPGIYDEIGHPLVVHSIPVTDQMKADVMDGQPMFSMVRGEESDNNVSTLERLESNDNFREAQQGANKVPGANNPTDAELDEVMFSLSKNNRSTIQGWLDKRSDLSDETKAQLMDYLDELDNSKLQLATARWFTKGTIRIPEDMPKVEQAVSVSEKAKVDPLQYDSPMALLEAHADFKPAEKRINPDEVSTLHKVKEFPEHGITIYDVDDTQESRENMRQIINTHFGKEASPWCLLQGDGNGNLTVQSEHYWKHYNAYPKQVAFKDGKLLAFSANDSSEIVWWDRQDEPHEGIPVTRVIEGDELGRTGEYDLTYDGILRLKKAFRGNKNNGVYEEWNGLTTPMRIHEEYKDGKRNGLFETWRPDGAIESRNHYKDDVIDGLAEYWHANGQKESERIYKDGTISGYSKTWYPNGNPHSIAAYNEYGALYGPSQTWYPDGQLEHKANYTYGVINGIAERYNMDGILIRRINYESGLKEGLAEYWHSNGQKEAEEHYHKNRLHGEKRIWDENGILLGIERFVDGGFEGICEWYYNSDNSLSRRAEYHNGILDGINITFYSQSAGGHPSSLSHYKEGYREGVFIIWSPDGKVERRALYRDGRYVRELPAEDSSEDTPLFSLVTDKAELERLESEPTITLYRAMQKVGPGEYIPPKSQKIPNSPEEKGKRLKAREPQKDGLWYRSDENPELAYEKDGKYYFDLKTANKNLGDVNGVLYNPYFHLSSWPLNDQFSAAYKSDGFVVVACEVPVSELSGKYKAEKANDSTGPKDWGSGPVTAQLGDGRQVVLSRYVKITGEVSDREVADIIAPKIKEKDITVPANVVTPSLRAELERRGVKIAEPINDAPMFSLSRSREDIISGAETEGWKGVMDKDDAQALRKEVFKLLPLSAKEAVVDAALGSDFNLRASLNNYLMRLAEGGLENDETGMLRHLYNSIRDLSGNESLTDADCRYIVWKEGQGAVGDDLMALATQQAFKNRFGVGRDTQEEQPQFSMAKDFSEATDESREKADSAVEEASENLKMAREAAKASAKGGDLKAIVKAMTAQKTYDKATVASVVRFAKEILKGGKVKSLSRREIGRLLGLIANSTGKAPSYVAKYTDQLTDQLLDIIVSDEKEAFAEMLSIRDKVVNKQGVEAQGALDILGQTTLKAMKAFMTKSKADIQTRREELSDLLDSKDDAVRQRALAEMDGLDLAEQYIDTVGASESEAYGLEDDLDAYKDAKKMGAIDKKTHDQFVKSVRDALRENKLERVDDYRAMRIALKEMMKKSTDKTAAFREGEKQHADQIRHDASRDLEGESAKVIREETRLSRLVNNKTVRFFLKPLATFDQMLRTFAKHNITGEGYLYNRFMSGFLKAREEYITNRDSGYAELDAKASEVFGREMKWTDLYRLGKRLPALTVRMWDGSQMSDVPLPQPNLLYIYMANKMTDGKMKLRRAGISEEDVEAIKNFLDPRLVTLGDWLQDEFLPARRNRYNAVYESLFGAPMPAIENYFPLKIAEGDRQVEVDVADGDVNNPLSSVITGSIIKRVRNSRMLDVANANVFDVAIEHLESMEDWAAYAHFRKDLNTLLSYRHFRNQVKNMSTVFGSGEQLWKNFIDVCKIAAGKYKSKGEHTQLLNVSKGATRARINFRPYTALKQLLSYPAFWVDASVDELWDGIHHPLVSWRWCMENLPLFRQRWEKRTIGDTRLMKTDSDWKVWEANLVKQASKSGMLPNALIDAFTVAIGAKAVYETKYKKYVSEGMSEELAAEKARQDATVVYNQSQQSDENAFISALQLDRTLEAAALTTFRNASMGYQRRVHGAYRTLGRLLRGKGREDYISSAEEQYISEGMSSDAARTRAEREYRKAGIKAAGEIFIYQFFLNYLWKLGPLGALYALVFGGDDDKKKKKLSDPALATAITGFFEGLSMGGTVTDLVTNLVSGNKVRDWNFLGLPILQDIKNITASLASRGIDSQSIYDLVGLLAQGWCGVDPRLLSDTLVAVVDAAEGDMGLAKEIGFLLMRVAQAPQSQIKDFYMDEIQATAEEAGEMSAAELALRYVKYRKLRRDPLSAFREEDEKEQRKDYSETKKLVKEAMGMDK